jgi:hypothetical protein
LGPAVLDIVQQLRPDAQNVRFRLLPLCKMPLLYSKAADRIASPIALSDFHLDNSDLK